MPAPVSFSLHLIAIVSLAPSSLHRSLALFFSPPLPPPSRSRCDIPRLLDASSSSICPFVSSERRSIRSSTFPYSTAFQRGRSGRTSAATTRPTLRPKIEIIMIESICGARGYGGRRDSLGEVSRGREEESRSAADLTLWPRRAVYIFGRACHATHGRTHTSFSIFLPRACITITRFARNPRRNWHKIS